MEYKPYINFQNLSRSKQEEVVKELRSEISLKKKKLERNLTPEELQTNPAYQRYIEMSKPKRLDNLKDETLRSLYRQYKYINELGTSNVEQAQIYANQIKPILNIVGKGTQEERLLWRMYNRAVEDKQFEDRFRYEAFDILHDFMIEKGLTGDTLKNLTQEDLDKIAREYTLEAVKESISKYEERERLEYEDDIFPF